MPRLAKVTNVGVQDAQVINHNGPMAAGSMLASRLFKVHVIVGMQS
jgi:hypothetical protein